MGFGIILFILSSLYAHSLGLVASFLFFSFFVLSARAAWLHLRDVELEISPGRQYATEDELCFFLNIKNPRLSPVFTLSFPDQKTFDLHGRQRKRAPFSMALGIGHHRVSPPPLTCSYPTGLFWAYLQGDMPMDLSVVPRRENMGRFCSEDFTLPRGRGEGENREDGVGGQEEFKEHRPFVEGDTLRSIDWKKGHGQTLWVKTYGGSGAESYLLDGDRMAARCGTPKDVWRSLSFWVDWCHTRGCDYALKIGRKKTPFGRGIQHRAALLDMIIDGSEKS